MNDQMPTAPGNPTPVDEMMDRIVAHRPRPQDWIDLADAARLDPSVWTLLTSAMRTDAAVGRTVEEASRRAKMVELRNPAPDAAPVPAIRALPGPGPGARSGLLGRLALWSGWAAAAALALSLLLVPERPIVDPAQGRVISPVARSADDALADYMRLGTREGRILDELPAITIDTLPDESGGGGVRVIYLRRLIEQRLVDEGDVFKLVQDEHGRAVPLPAPAPARVSGASRHST